MLDKKVTRWRQSRLHRKCKYCKYCSHKEYHDYCEAKKEVIKGSSFSYEKGVNLWRPFCNLFDVEGAYEQPKVSDDRTSREGWSWEGYPGTGPRG